MTTPLHCRNTQPVSTAHNYTQLHTTTHTQPLTTTHNYTQLHTTTHTQLHGCCHCYCRRYCCLYLLPQTLAGLYHLSKQRGGCHYSPFSPAYPEDLWAHCQIPRSPFPPCFPCPIRHSHDSV